MKHGMVRGVLVGSVVLVVLAGHWAAGAGGRQAPRKLIPSTIAQVGWMEGAWVARDGSASIEEL